MLSWLAPSARPITGSDRRFSAMKHYKAVLTVIIPARGTVEDMAFYVAVEYSGHIILFAR